MAIYGADIKMTAHSVDIFQKMINKVNPQQPIDRSSSIELVFYCPQGPRGTPPISMALCHGTNIFYDFCLYNQQQRGGPLRYENDSRKLIRV